MRYIKQLFIILLISFIGELLNIVLPLPIPAAIYGLALMLLALQLRIVKMHQVEDVGNFLLDVMPLMFIPYAVGMLPIWPQLQGILFPLILISIVCTILVFLVTGRVTQFIINRKGRTAHE